MRVYCECDECRGGIVSVCDECRGGIVSVCDECRGCERGSIVHSG